MVAHYNYQKGKRKHIRYATINYTVVPSFLTSCARNFDNRRSSIHTVSSHQHEHTLNSQSSALQLMCNVKSVLYTKQNGSTRVFTSLNHFSLLSKTHMTGSVNIFCDCQLLCFNLHIFL